MPSKLLEVTVMVLSSKSDFISHKNKSARKILNRIGPSIEPCGNPERIDLKN